MDWIDALSKGWGPVVGALIAGAIALVLDFRSGRQAQHWQSLKAEIEFANLLDERDPLRMQIFNHARHNAGLASLRLRKPVAKPILALVLKLTASTAALVGLILATRWVASSTFTLVATALGGVLVIITVRLMRRHADRISNWALDRVIGLGDFPPGVKYGRGFGD